ncbi:MAG: NYN domain-containing protein [Nanoarchaeota archaeon]
MNDLNGTLVFLDGGFLSKLNKHFGNGKYIKYNLVKFAKNLAQKQKLFCKHIFYYNAPPFQETSPTSEQRRKREGYDKFVKALLKNKEITVREGRLQRLKIIETFSYKQKGVDTLVTIDLSHIKEDFPNIDKIILVACDTDFCPVVDDIKKRGIKVILYTYFDRIRDTPFSRANHLISCCSNCYQLKKQDFEECTDDN